MNARIGGQRPRPRVALLGSFGDDDVVHFLRVFPTLWRADRMARLLEQVDVKEIDLLVIAPDITGTLHWPQETHVVCFSKNIDHLPGPITHSFLRASRHAETEEFFSPEVPLSISRRREADYGDLSSVRGWSLLDLNFEINAYGPGIPEDKRTFATNIFNNGAIICERHTNSPLAVAFTREESNLGVGWLPNVTKNRATWVELLIAQWAQSDKDAFPGYGDWTNSPEWMVPQELQILSQIQTLEQKKREVAIGLDKQIGELSTQLDVAKTDANNGRRRLVTAQGQDLVDEVARGLGDIGFVVVKVDDLVGEKTPRREDLRLQVLPKGSEQWNAIAEVRGYGRSGGTTADLQRLARFADLYKKETGKAPDKRIYIVNGELDLPPSQRQKPLASATEDLEIFSESDGILIWSVDLFRALKTTKPANYPFLLESIKCAKGRWVPIKP